MDFSELRRISGIVMPLLLRLQYPREFLGKFQMLNICRTWAGHCWKSDLVVGEKLNRHSRWFWLGLRTPEGWPLRRRAIRRWRSWSGLCGVVVSLREGGGGSVVAWRSLGCPNFGGSVLECTEVDFLKQLNTSSAVYIFSRTTRLTRFCTALNSAVTVVDEISAHMIFILRILQNWMKIRWNFTNGGSFYKITEICRKQILKPDFWKFQKIAGSQWIYQKFYEHVQKPCDIL